MISKQPKYHVKYGPWSTDYIIVDGDELEMLFYAKGRGSFFSGRYGGVDTKKIEAVRPDYKETYGTMPEYELVGEDMDEIRQVHGNMQARLGMAQDRVRYLTETKQEHLIGKNVPLPELDKPKTERREGTIKRIGDIMR